ncbi:extracellular solute-binding protein [Marispirochaeta aestuarii]|uniref:ABC transporter substrate-binding protein n=1 Tax=Marispirochaeta aestuarii TaxID=1963862 RepID=UPI0029C7D8AF|nr:extracellular solute-binding protein [Marispirochaeta aestuarii]
MVKRRVFLLALSFLVLATGIVSANGAQEDEGDIKLTYWMISGGRVTHAEYAIEAFKKIRPDVEVELVVNSTDDHKKNLKIAASSGSMPSMWYNWGGSLGSFYSENGLSYDLTKYAQEHDWANKYRKTSLELATLDGIVAGVPAQISMFGIMYRKDLFEKAGITSEPSTFEEWEKNLKKIKDAGIIPFALGGKNGWQLFRLIELLIEKNLGAAKHDKLLAMDTDLWLDPGITQSFAEYKSYVDSGYFPNGFITQEPNDARMLIYNGLAAMTIDGASLIAMANSDGRDISQFGFFPMPLSDKGNRMISFIGMTQLSAKLTDRELEAAIDFTDTLFSQEVIDAVGGSVQHPVANSKIPVPADQPIVQEVTDALAEHGGFLITDQGLPQEVVTKLFEVQDAVASGKMTPAEVGPFMKKISDTYLATH